MANTRGRSVTNEFWKNRLEEDLRAMGLPGHWKVQYIATNRIACFVRLLRLTEHRRSQSGLASKALYVVTRLLYDRLSERMGFDIPLGVFGPGLSIAHRGTIVVNGDARIGKNCRIHPGVTIGASNGEAPKIGDNVFIGPGVGVFGGVVIGQGAVLGPHSLINSDIPSASTTMAPRAEIRTRKGPPWSHAESPLGPTYGGSSSKNAV